MDPLDEQVEAVVSLLRASGRVAGIAPDAPDYVKKAFLEVLLGCPECPEGMMKK